jgi:hypothetical protein
MKQIQTEKKKKEMDLVKEVIVVVLVGDIDVLLKIM